MRRGEITSQRWEDIDFPRKLLFVTRSKTPEGESREIPLTARIERLMLEGRKPEGLVVSFRGRPVRIVKRTWKTALRNARIRHVRFHDLRHTFNTHLMEAGVLQEIRMALMGHSPGSRVHATYTHIELPVKRDAIRKLEQWVNQQRQQQTKEADHASTQTEMIRRGVYPQDGGWNGWLGRYQKALVDTAFALEQQRAKGRERRKSRDFGR